MADATSLRELLLPTPLAQAQYEAGTEVRDPHAAAALTAVPSGVPGAGAGLPADALGLELCNNSHEAVAEGAVEALSVPRTRQPAPSVPAPLGVLRDDERAWDAGMERGAAMAPPKLPVRSRLELAARGLLKLAPALSGMQLCAALGAAAGTPASRRPRWRTVLQCLWLAVLVLLVTLIVGVRARVLLSGASSLSWKAVSMLVIAGNLLGLFGGWYTAYSHALRLNVRMQDAAVVHVVDTLPRGIAFALAIPCATALTLYFTSLPWWFPWLGGVPSGAEVLHTAEGLVFTAAMVTVEWGTYGSLCCMLAGHILPLVRSLDLLARAIPAQPAAEVTRSLQCAAAQQRACIRPRAVSALILGKAFLVIACVCSIPPLLTGQLHDAEEFRHSSWLQRAVAYVFVAGLPACYTAMAMTALYCVSEVSEGWLAVLRALYAHPAGGGLDATRFALSLQLSLAWQRGRLGVSVFGLAITRALVLRGLLAVGTLLGLLMRLEPRACSAA